jgi:hypothetical protein
MSLKRTLGGAILGACLINVTPVLAQSMYGPQYSYGPSSDYDSTHKPPEDWSDQRHRKHSQYGNLARQCVVDPAGRGRSCDYY